MDKPAPQALYRRAKSFVHGKLSSGEWKPGDLIPSENRLVVEDQLSGGALFRRRLHFRPALSGLSNAFSAAGPGIGLPLLHLAVLAGAFWAIARLALRRFAAR